jgi:transposase InsO family protein
MEMSQEFSVSKLCEIMGVSRSGFYKWKTRMNNPAPRTKSFISNVMLFKEYHNKYPSHGYRWLNAKIRLDTGLIISDTHAYKCCKVAGIKSISKHYRYRKPGNPYRLYPNLMIAEMNVDGPMQCIVSDMTAFYVKGVYYELTLYMDIWNNEILAHALSSKRGDRETYISGLNEIKEMKMKYPNLDMVLHTDQGSVYSSKNFNELLPAYGITRSMSRAGTPTDNAAMEAINGWMKAEMFTDLHVTGERNVKDEVDDYIQFFNNDRPAYALNYLTPAQYKELYAL